MKPINGGVSCQIVEVSVVNIVLNAIQPSTNVKSAETKGVVNQVKGIALSKDFAMVVV